jgi:hypothetical protein
MKTFEYLIPTRDYINNGGSVLGKMVKFHLQDQELLGKVASREDNSLVISDDGKLIYRASIDMSWIFVNIIL